MNQKSACDKSVDKSSQTNTVPEHYLRTEDVKDYFRSCKRQSLQYVPGTLPYLETSTHCVEVIFFVCRQMNQPSETRYIAVELYDKFMTHHFLDLHKLVEESTQNRSCKKRQLKTVRERVRKQSLLRILSCVQLASKFVLSEKKINGSQVQQFLASTGHWYSLNSVKCSEQRVLTTINFEIPTCTPLKYLEILLAYLQKSFPHEIKDEINRPTLHTISKSVLDVAYLQRQELFHRFFWMATSRWERTHQERIKFLEVEADNVFLSIAVITCALQIREDNATLVSFVSEKLGQLTDTPVKQITGFATLLFQTILGTGVLDVTA